MYVPHKDIKFGDASPVVRANRDKSVFDEFEYDQTSVRRIVALLAQHLCSLHAHPPSVCIVSHATHMYRICISYLQDRLSRWHYLVA